MEQIIPKRFTSELIHLKTSLKRPYELSQKPNFGYEKNAMNMQSSGENGNADSDSTPENKDRTLCPFTRQVSISYLYKTYIKIKKITNIVQDNLRRSIK